MMKTVFYGPLGGKDGSRIGGGESGNKKTLKVLEKLGLNTYLVEKPYPSNSKILRVFYPLQLVLSFFHYLLTVIKIPKLLSVHVSGFYNHLIYHEFALVYAAKLLGKKCIYEIRAGGMIEAYRERTIFYRFFFKQTIKSASVVLCQGKEYIEFIKSFSETPSYYYPNFILDEMLQRYTLNNRESSSSIKLVYFGRISESKNITFLIEIARDLKDRLVDFELDIIGGGEVRYVEQLKSLIKAYSLENECVIHNPHSPEELAKKLVDKHFFLFPTIEKREGHSNSLTEAMSAGVVPIASNIGFNKSIVGNSALIVDEFIPSDYSNAILDVWEKGNWISLSQSVYNRIADTYTEKTIVKTLSFAYNHQHASVRESELSFKKTTQ